MESLIQRNPESSQNPNRMHLQNKKTPIMRFSLPQFHNAPTLPRHFLVAVIFPSQTIDPRQ